MPVGRDHSHQAVGADFLPNALSVIGGVDQQLPIGLQTLQEITVVTHARDRKLSDPQLIKSPYVGSASGFHRACVVSHSSTLPNAANAVTLSGQLARSQVG